MVERSTRSARSSIAVRSSEEGTQNQDSRQGASSISWSTTFQSDRVNVQAPMSLNRMRQLIEEEALSAEQVQVLNARIRELTKGPVLKQKPKPSSEVSPRNACVRNAMGLVRLRRRPSYAASQTWLSWPYLRVLLRVVCVAFLVLFAWPSCFLFMLHVICPVRCLG
ncbi:hypothetical protein V1517DRAFT_333039 [Lipomyces orientalis]|uniref:Uncharacterized protein n=1 Tax=Lipomyces orientalis TaxID=1233043 RepID=A0ACC3TDU8_9ASCO